MKYLIALVLIASLKVASGQDYITALENSIERSKGASGVEVYYILHLTPTFVRTFHAKDFDTGKMYTDSTGKPMYYELTKSQGEEKDVLVIDLSTIAFVEFTITYPKGNCEYKFDFYY